MTTTPPEQPGFQPPQPYVPPELRPHPGPDPEGYEVYENVAVTRQHAAPKKKDHTLLIAFAIVGGILLLLVLLGACVAGLATLGSTPAPGSSKVSAAASPTCYQYSEPYCDKPTEEPTQDPGDFRTTKSDWKATLKTTDKECFGSAGCNVEVRVKLGYYGDSSQIPEDATIEITYKIKGGEDGPVIGTTEVTNRNDYDVNSESVSTRSRSSKLTVDVTDVEVY